MRAYKSEEMQAAVTLLRPLERLENGVCLVELTFLNGLVDTNNVLPDDTTSTNVQMSMDRWTENGQRHQ